MALYIFKIKLNDLAGMTSSHGLERIHLPGKEKKKHLSKCSHLKSALFKYIITKSSKKRI